MARSDSTTTKDSGAMSNRFCLSVGTGCDLDTHLTGYRRGSVRTFGRAILRTPFLSWCVRIGTRSPRADSASKLPKVIDARRADDTVVAIKWIPDAEHTRHELDVLRFLSADEMRRDPRNHCAPLLDTFGHPTIAAGVFVVSPWLSPLEFWAPRYVNDLADLMLQCFEVRPALRRMCCSVLMILGPILLAFARCCASVSLAFRSALNQ